MTLQQLLPKNLTSSTFGGTNGSSVGPHTYGHIDVFESSYQPNDKVIIGDYTSIGVGCRVLVGGDHRRCITNFPFFKNDSDGKTTRIGNDVHLGNDVVIISGANIGDGCIVGANSVVRGTMPPYSICYGNPCMPRRYRYEQEQIQELLRIKWWDWSEEVIESRLPDFLLPIDEFIEKYKI